MAIQLTSTSTSKTNLKSVINNLSDSDYAILLERTKAGELQYREPTELFTGLKDFKYNSGLYSRKSEQESQIVLSDVVNGNELNVTKIQELIAKGSKDIYALKDIVILVARDTGAQRKIYRFLFNKSILTPKTVKAEPVKAEKKVKAVKASEPVTETAPIQPVM